MNGHVTVVYEIAGQQTQQELSETNVSVSDGSYHSVLMTRQGTNVTLSVDNAHVTSRSSKQKLRNKINVTIGEEKSLNISKSLNIRLLVELHGMNVRLQTMTKKQLLWFRKY